MAANEVTVHNDSEVQYDQNPDEHPKLLSVVSHESFALVRGGKIARCTANIIFRGPDYDSREGGFWKRMFICSDNARDLVQDLFDKKGCLQPIFWQAGSAARGTGVWGRELNTGTIVLLETFSVTRDWRRRRIGTTIFRELVDCVRRGNGDDPDFFVLVKPGMFADADFPNAMRNDETKLDEGVEPQDTAEKFYRSLGFRRVGYSPWLAYSSNPQHPSRRLDAANDVRENLKHNRSKHIQARA